MTDKERMALGIKGLTPKKREWHRKYLFDPKRKAQAAMPDAVGQLRLFTEAKVNGDHVQRN